MSMLIRKKLSPNDLGETGSHQAGMLVPKEERILAFFPSLAKATKNPRARLIVRERGDGTRWEFNYIYYNGKFFGGTRNEFRLTGMTRFLRAIGARVGDEILLTQDDNQSYIIDIVRSATICEVEQDGVLTLSGGWKILLNFRG